jgi:hypothetical protein
VLTVIYDSATGNLYIDNPLEDLTGINFESESGIFTDAEEADLWWNAMFTDLDEGAIGSAVFGSFFTGDCDLGEVATAGLDESFLLNDLTLTYTRAGVTGSLLATLVVI